MLCLKVLSRNARKLSVPSSLRTFLSSAYYCEEVWQRRLNNPILKNIKVEDMYIELEQRFQKTRQISAIDVDIFVNAVDNDEYLNELQDVVHKLRLTADTMNMLGSTSHAVVRSLRRYDKCEELLQILDDPLNYGVFLDYYTANLLMDHFWKSKDYTSGARVASQLMLQEEFEHPLSLNLALLHCYKYLLQPGEWNFPPTPKEPEEEVKVRVKYIRNPYFDDHFDLRDPTKIVGKTLATLTVKKMDSLHMSLHVLGWVLYDKKDKVKETLEKCKVQNIKLCKEILNLIDDKNEFKTEIASLATESVNIEEMLIKHVEKTLQSTLEKDIADQCLQFSKWEDERKKALDEQIQRLSIQDRLAQLENIKKDIKEKETKLWFFENVEKIELDIESNEVVEAQEKSTEKKKSKDDENYIPPEIKPAKVN